MAKKPNGESSPDFCHYINALLDGKSSDEISSLKNNYKEKQNNLEKTLFEYEIKHSETFQLLTGKLSNAKDSIKSLSSAASEISTLTSKSEKRLKWLCKDIQKLDTAKKNLQTVTESMEKLVALENTLEKIDRLYGESVKLTGEEFSNSKLDVEDLYVRKGGLFSKITGYFRDFEGLYKSVLVFGKDLDCLKRLEVRSEKIKNYFTDQIYEEFGRFKALVSFESMEENRREAIVMTLRNGSLLVETIDSEKRKSVKFLRDWIVELHTWEYEKNVLKKIESISFEQIKEQLTNFAKILKMFNSKYKEVMPEEWEIPYFIAERFNLLTIGVYEKLITKLIDSIPVMDHIKIIQLLTKFEDELETHFSKKFLNQMSSVFLMYSDKYIINERNNLKSAIDSFANISKNEIITTENIKQNRIVQTDSIFHCIKESFNVCRNIKIFNIFFAICTEYKFSLNILFSLLESISNVDKNVTNPESFSVEIDALKCICLILGTNEKNVQIVEELQIAINKRYKTNKFIGKAPVEFGEQIEFLNAFSNKLINRIALLVSLDCRKELLPISKIHREKSILSQKSNRCIASFGSNLKRSFDCISKFLPQKHYLVLSGRFVTTFSEQFKQIVYCAKGVDKISAEQFLVDVYSVKSLLVKCVVSDSDLSPPMATVVRKGIAENVSKIESIAKVLSSDEFSLETFCMLFPANSAKDLEMILKMKFREGDKKVDLVLKRYMRIIKPS